MFQPQTVLPILVAIYSSSILQSADFLVVKLYYHLKILAYFRFLHIPTILKIILAWQGACLINNAYIGGK